jgi:hypothetical protein
MSKLDPKPNRKNLSYSWDELNHFLQSYFSAQENDYVLIDVRNYIMPKEEIVNELKQNGYEVSERNEHQLKVE